MGELCRTGDTPSSHGWQTDICLFILTEEQILAIYWWSLFKWKFLILYSQLSNYSIVFHLSIDIWLNCKFTPFNFTQGVWHSFETILHIANSVLMLLVFCLCVLYPELVVLNTEGEDSAVYPLTENHVIIGRYDTKQINKLGIKGNRKKYMTVHHCFHDWHFALTR